MKQHNSNIIASVGTAIFMILVFLLLWFVLIGYTPEPEDEGLMISFGYSETGGGMENGEMAMPAESMPSMAEPTSSSPSDNNLLTQDDEETLALQRAQEEKRKRDEALEKERRQREREEAARREQERLEAERVAAENAKRQQAIDKANQMGALFGQTNNPEGGNGTGESASSAVKGNPLGHGTSGGNDWSLNGRSLKGALPAPSNNFKQEGKVVVNIIVDANGKVVSATVGAGTTVSDESTRQLARQAALKAEFNLVDKPDKAMGTITYYFKFK